MRKRATRRIVSLILCLAMMFTCLQASATALTLEDVEQAINKLAHYTVDELPQKLRKHLNSGWSRSKLDVADAESENVLTTINPDGTKTLYSYDSPIKYVDEEGYVRFIDSSLKPCGKADGLFDWYSYENTANDVKTYFPLFIGTGVLVESEQGDIRMTPKGSKISMSSKTEEDNTEYVLYEDVFDKDTDIRYTAINEGIKEDIILNAYNGNNTFEYIVEAEGLTPVRDTGKTIEFIDGNLQTAYTLGEIVLFDSAEMPATNSNSHYTVEELKEGKYLVTLVIDEEFLTDEDTVYPVVIDPIVKQTHNIKKFRSSNYCSLSYMTSHDNSFDILTAEDYGTAAGVMHLQMTDMQDFAHINPEKVTGAYLNIYLHESPTCNFTLNVNTKNFSTEPTPESLTWSEVRQVASSTPESSEYVVAGTTAVGLSITDIFKDWLTVETKSYMLSSRISKSDGLFVSATGMPSGYEIIVCAPCHPDPSVFPSVAVTYEEDEDLESGFYRIQSGYYNQTARYLTANASGNVLYDLDTNNSNQLWYVEKSTDEMMSDAYAGDYLIYSVGQNKYMSFSLLNNTVGWYEQFEQPAQTLSDCALKIVDQSNGYKRIVNPSSKKQLAALNYGKENNTPIVQEVMKGLDNQRWKFEKVESFIDTNNPSTYQMVVGETEHLSYTAVDVNATFSISCTPPNSVISYRQSGDSLTTKHITVDAIGEGEATLTVYMTTNDAQTGGQQTTSISWKFIVGAQTIAINKSTLSLNVGDTEDLDATSRPNLPIVWSSSNENVATVDSQGKVTAINEGVCTVTARFAEYSSVYDTCEVWVRGKTPVFLIHGRTSNSEDVWGIKNSIPEGQNDHIDVNMDATASNGLKYSLVQSQWIDVNGIYENSGDTNGDGSEDDEEKPRNLGKELVSSGYTANVNLFAFNYPNEDVVWKNASRFYNYITNLIAYVRNYGSDEMKACFYKSKQDYINNNYSFNIVGHSMGGLVARYYIENIGQDEHVDKLVTIGTPHWGSGYANLSNELGLLHVLCDHDLDVRSAMYGGENSTDLNEIGSNCMCQVLDIPLTGELQYYNERHTKYYAIAGIDFNEATLGNQNNYFFDMPNSFTTYTQIWELFMNIGIKEISNESEDAIPFDIWNDGDNLVSFMSQIGWTEQDFCSKIIQMDKISFIADTDGGNSLLSRLHNKAPHRQVVINAVCDYLEE